ncbi:NADH-ubiquinone oxidoreductase-F iron-sulfur binding region domain-containing protein [Streptomyces sp. NPDC006283]|uniref:NADH-ubiquinone oxidoreductase-F iron-sulfur binding region domain-containing protein n=1 Tax=Streptomyces sp. NPDC006283 TaxID=3156741 RepID=UPI0033BF5CC4
MTTTRALTLTRTAVRSLMPAVRPTTEVHGHGPVPGPCQGSGTEGPEHGPLPEASVHLGTVLGARPDRLETAAAYVAHGGYGAATTPDALLGHLAANGLRGRGGAGFPTATKLAAVRDAGGAPVVVANGEEGEPGSVKDRWLLRARPHLVLDGLARAAAVVGARRAYVYLADPTAAVRVRRALAEHPPPLPVEIVETEHTYVAGEETAVVRRINGGPALPLAKPPRPFQRGVGDEPTLVSNVETLARIALIAARPALGRRIADATLMTLSGAGVAPLLTEVPYGTTLRSLALAHGGPGVHAALMGGLFGGLVAERSLDLPVDPGRLADAGTALGCGAVRFLGPHDCPVTAAAEAAAHLAAESARQCGVCVAGSGSIRDALQRLSTGTAADDVVGALGRWSAGLPGRGACGLLDAAAGNAGSLLHTFPALVDAHLAAPCPACAAAAGTPGAHAEAHPVATGARLTVPVPEVSDNSLPVHVPTAALAPARRP